MGPLSNCDAARKPSSIGEQQPKKEQREQPLRLSPRQREPSWSHSNAISLCLVLVAFVCAAPRRHFFCPTHPDFLLIGRYLRGQWKSPSSEGASPVSSTTYPRAVSVGLLKNFVTLNGFTTDKEKSGVAFQSMMAGLLNATSVVDDCSNLVDKLALRDCLEVLHNNNTAPKLRR